MAKIEQRALALLGFGVVLSWMFAREFTDGTITGLFALVWNLIGVAMWYLQVNMSADQLAAMTEAQRQVYEATPGWLNIAFAVAVFAGVLGALGMLLKKKWAATMFLLSLIPYLGSFIVMIMCLMPEKPEGARFDKINGAG